MVFSYEIEEIELNDRWFSVIVTAGRIVQVAEYVNNGELAALSGAALVAFIKDFGGEVFDYIAEVERSAWEDGWLAAQC